MPQNDAKKLLEKHRNGSATDEEKTLLGDWILFGKFEAQDLKPEALDNDLSLIGQGLPLKTFKTRTLWPRIAAAAIVLVFLSIGGYFLLHKEKAATALVAQKPAQVILPGGNKATLTLANGETIVLANAKLGQLATQGGATIDKTSDGNIVYNSNTTQWTDAKLTYNTLATPRGGQHQFTLSDGTKVWLNAASSLKYPAIFYGKERRVMLTGEAYFEVAKNKAMPFHVEAGTQDVQVLGTHFNISSYSDEPAMRTTLLEGSIRLIQGGRSAILKPGQQAVIEGNGIKVNEVDADDYIAWKNGYFAFRNEDLAGVLRKVSRWYDVDVEYKEDLLKGRTFSGTISRYDDVSKVLKTLELINALHFTVEGRTIKVKK